MTSRAARLGLAALATVLLAAPAGASQRREGRGPRPDSTWWRDPAVAARLSLTPEQKQKLEERHAAGNELDVEGRTAIDRETARFDELLSAEPLDLPAISGKIERVVAVRRLWAEALGRRLLAMREMLSVRQWRALRDVPPEPTPRPERRASSMPLGRWWTQQPFVESLALLAADQDRLDRVFADFRPRLGATRDAIRKLDGELRNLLDVEPLDRALCLERLASAAAAREEMDRAVFRLRLDLQKELSPEQRRAFRRVRDERARSRVP